MAVRSQMHAAYVLKRCRKLSDNSKKEAVGLNMQF